MQIPDIQILSYGSWNNPNKYKKTKPRFVLTYELELHHVAYGETVINGCTYPIEEGSITFTRPGDLRHGILKNPDPNTDFFYFVIKEDLPSDPITRILEKLPNYFPPSRELTRLWSALWKSYSTRSDEKDDIAAACHLLLLLTQLAKYSNVKPIASPQLPLQSDLFEVIGFMREHLSENLSVGDMAAHLGYSQSHFQHLFKSYTQHTPYSYFLSLKINHARYLLLNTDKSLAEISEALGFGKVGQFSDTFKKELHVTPAKFRKQRDVALYND